MSLVVERLPAYCRGSWGRHDIVVRDVVCGSHISKARLRGDDGPIVITGKAAKVGRAWQSMQANTRQFCMAAFSYLL